MLYDINNCYYISELFIPLSMKKSLLLISLLLAVYSVSPVHTQAQSMRGIKVQASKAPYTIIDYANDKASPGHVPLREALQNAAGRVAGTAVFEVEYINFTQAQRDAFQYAVDIWASLIESAVPIRIKVEMKGLGQGVLGQAGPTARYANFPNAQMINTFYVVAMAEKMAGMELNNPGDPEISMELNNEFSWYFGTDGQVPAGKFDFVSVVLHEIGHGLGFTDGMWRTSDGTGYYTVWGAPLVYDRHIETANQDNVVDTYQDGTAELGDVLVGGKGDLFFRSFTFPDSASRPQLYAPATWSGGSSIAHLDEATYPPGNPNSLMSPRFDYQESIHDPGLALNMLADMGWVAMDIDFPRILDSEDSTSDRTLVLTAVGDSAVINNGVVLHYTYSDFTNEVTVTLSPTGNANEYTGVIPATGQEERVKYYISVESQGGQVFTSPGEAPQYFWDFVMAKDTIAPEISHDSVSLVFMHDLVVPIAARVVENIGLNDLQLTYRVNGGATTTIAVPQIALDTSGIIVADYYLDWDLSGLGVNKGDVIEYKLSITDKSSAANSDVLPKSGYYAITVDALNPVADYYKNDFNTSSDDFIGQGFSIITESGFTDGAIHSNHPYRTTDGTTPADTLTLYYVLKTPIVLSDKDASLVFDEVVLIEPGSDGTVFGDDRFWDYAIVEASKDKGETWLPVADGYDSREQQVWLDRWESDMDANGNSLATGDNSLFVSKEIDLTANGNFAPNDTVLVRFRIYADQLAHGWGWAIDNLRIQVDEKPPVIRHITPDYLLVGDDQLTLKARVTDNVEVDSVTFEMDLNGNVQTVSMPGTAENLSLNVTFAAPIAASDVFKYRIIAVDKALQPNTATLPASGYYQIPVAVLGAAKDSYVNDFNSTSDDFVGVNFSIRQDDKFNSPALLTNSPYPNAAFDTFTMAYLLKYPIKLRDRGAYMQFDEGVLTQPGADQVAVEVSTDNGQTWFAAFDPYDASEFDLWKNIFDKYDEEGNSTGFGEPFMIETRTFNLLDNPQLSGGEEVLLRFRLTVNDTTNGWGWFIDNLEIQGPATGLADEQADLDLTLYPNPASGFVQLRARVDGQSATITLTDMAGRRLISRQEAVVNNSLLVTLPLSGLRQGLYLVTVTAGGATQTKRLLVE